MCFISRDRTEYVAEEDIICYKHGMRLANNDYMSSFKYAVYNGNMPEVNLWDNSTDDTFLAIEEGYHSYRRLPDAENNDWGEEVAKFVIPKGSKYYKGYNQYVSNNIKFIEWL